MRGIPALACALVLAWGVTTAEADVVPVEGPWHATTSAGLPVGFSVTAGQIVNPRWRFKWGFCGSFENAAAATVPIEPGGHWKYVDSRGPWIEGTVVAPDRIEGTVTAPSRMLPGCPETHASFVAEPGEASFEQAAAVVRADVGSRRLLTEPAGMTLRRDGSLRFYGLRWSEFGQPVARAAGRAYVRRGCRGCRGTEVKRPRVVVYLNELTQQGDHRVYLHVHYDLHGPVPRGVRHSGGRLLE
jgi:hypothetical protein